MTTSEALATLLQEAGQGTLGVDLYWDHLPDTPTPALAVVVSEELWERGSHDAAAPSMVAELVQIVSRAATVEDARARADAAQAALARRWDRNMGGLVLHIVLRRRRPWVVELTPGAREVVAVAEVEAVSS